MFDIIQTDVILQNQVHLNDLDPLNGITGLSGNLHSQLTKTTVVYYSCMCIIMMNMVQFGP